MMDYISSPLYHFSIVKVYMYMLSFCGGNFFNVCQCSYLICMFMGRDSPQYTPPVMANNYGSAVLL
jgi:hypothetical protein